MTGALSDEKTTLYGDELYDALVSRRPVAPLSARETGMTVVDAYRIQQRTMCRRLTGTDRVIGRKIGLTSLVIQRALGVDRPDFGQLLASMNSTGIVNTGELIAPKAEGEVAFLLKHDLAGPGVTAAGVLQATELVMPCFEVCDSRIRDWKIKLVDTVADNASAGRFVLGSQGRSPRDVELVTCGMVIYKNGSLECTGAGAAALGSPINCVVWLANALGALGSGLKAGELILSGALGPMIPVVAGDSLHLAIGGMGTASVHFT
jgi:2-oxopent-4-enoate/cis-2-oxohex-4-enoate hydratase